MRGAAFFFGWIFGEGIAAAFIDIFFAGFFFAGAFFIALGALWLAATARALRTGFFDLAFDVVLIVRFMMVSCLMCGEAKLLTMGERLCANV